LSRHEKRLQCSKIFSNSRRIGCLKLSTHGSIGVLNTLHDSLQIRGSIRARRGWACGRNCWSTLSTATATTSTAAATASALSSARRRLSCDCCDHYGENNTNRNKKRNFPH
jgi:hypothetical protein